MVYLTGNISPCFKTRVPIYVTIANITVSVGCIIFSGIHLKGTSRTGKAVINDRPSDSRPTIFVFNMTTGWEKK